MIRVSYYVVVERLILERSLNPDLGAQRGLMNRARSALNVSLEAENIHNGSAHTWPSLIHLNTTEDHDRIASIARAHSMHTHPQPVS